MTFDRRRWNGSDGCSSVIPRAGWRSAVIYSMLISARRRGLNPQDYLTDILARLPSIKITHLHELLPGNWKPESRSAG
jgi:hypothetical protein